MRLGLSLLAVAVLAAVAQNPYEQYEKSLLKVGAQAPAVKVTTPDGKSFDLMAVAKEKKAKAILLNFWFST